jgi:CRP-like cAMP-binding protein
VLSDFTPQEVDVLGSLMLHVRAQPGQMLIKEGEIDDWMLLLLRGTVDVGKRIGPEANHEERGDNTRLAVLRPGTVLGEMSMFDGEPRYASCWALSEVEAAVLDRVAVARLVKFRPDIGAKLLVKLTQLLAKRLRNTSAQLVKVLRTQVA